MESLPLLNLHTDGASRGNPGAAAFAYVIKTEDARTIEDAGCLGTLTNNQAEYVALIRALRRALQIDKHLRLLVHSDSELMVKQMNGQYRVKDSDLRSLYQEARDLCKEFTGGVRIVHVRRADNKRADALCNEVLDAQRKGTGGKDYAPAETDPVEAVAPLVPPRRESDKPAPTVSAEALTCLRDAEAAWRRGDELPTAETVWRWLVEILARHGVTALGTARTQTKT